MANKEEKSYEKNFIIYYNNKENLIKNSIDSKSMSLSVNNKESLKVLETNKIEDKYKPLTKQNFTWFNYFSYIITCKLTNPKISCYGLFRKEVKNHINIFKLLIFCNIENCDPFLLKNNTKNIC